MGVTPPPSAEDGRYLRRLHALTTRAILVGASMVTSAAAAVVSLVLLLGWQRLLPCLILMEAAGAGATRPPPK